jgi:dGTPase
VAPALRAIETTCPGADAERRRHELVRRLIGDMVGDLLIETKRRLHEARPTSAAGVRALGRPIAAFSAAMQAMDKELKTFLFQRMYRHQRVTRMTATAKQVVSELFRRFVDDPERLPTEWRTQTHGRGRGDVARIVADYIAGMTDRFAFDEHARIVNG